MGPSRQGKLECCHADPSPNDSGHADAGRETAIQWSELNQQPIRLRLHPVTVNQRAVNCTVKGESQRSDFEALAVELWCLPGSYMPTAEVSFLS